MPWCWRKASRQGSSRRHATSGRRSLEHRAHGNDGSFSPPAKGWQVGIRHTACHGLWIPGQPHPNLAWSLYRQLIKVKAPAARAFYEIAAIKSYWKARELEPQIASPLFERLATKGQAFADRLHQLGAQIFASVRHRHGRRALEKRAHGEATPSACCVGIA